MFSLYDQFLESNKFLLVKSPYFCCWKIAYVHPCCLNQQLRSFHMFCRCFNITPRAFLFGVEHGQASLGRPAFAWQAWPAESHDSNCDFHETWGILWRNHLLLDAVSINQKTLLKSFCLNVHSRKMSIGYRCTVYICWILLVYTPKSMWFFLPHDP